jgi:hypothetical protein
MCPMCLCVLKKLQIDYVFLLVKYNDFFVKITCELNYLFGQTKLIIVVI